MIAGKIAGRMLKRNIGDIRDMKANLDMTLYLVTDSTYHTEESFYKTIEEACQGGVTLVQLREKNCGGREYLEKARKVKVITDRYQIPLIIDDSKTLFTNYSTFVRFLTDQGAPRPELFEGSFLRLDNSTVTIMPR